METSAPRKDLDLYKLFSGRINLKTKDLCVSKNKLKAELLAEANKENKASNRRKKKNQKLNKNRKARKKVLDPVPEKPSQLPKNGCSKERKRRQEIDYHLRRALSLKKFTLSIFIDSFTNVRIWNFHFFRFIHFFFHLLLRANRSRAHGLELVGDWLSVKD